VIVTGAAGVGGIGEAIAQRVGEEGGVPVLTSRREADAKKAAARVGGKAEGRACDLTREADCDALVRDVVRAHGRLDGIVHNAGAPITDWDRPFLDTPVEAFAKVFDVDVLGSIRLTRAALPAMRPKGGSLVFTSSTAALAGYEHLHEFSPAKAGLLGLMKGLASELARDGIRANAVAYGNIGSPGTLGALDETQRESLAHESPMRRWGAPREAAGGVVFLLSDLASFVNGQTLVIDGGTVMR